MQWPLGVRALEPGPPPSHSAYSIAPKSTMFHEQPAASWRDDGTTSNALYYNQPSSTSDPFLHSYPPLSTHELPCQRAISRTSVLSPTSSFKALNLQTAPQVSHIITVSASIQAEPAAAIQMIPYASELQSPVSAYPSAADFDSDHSFVLSSDAILDEMRLYSERHITEALVTHGSKTPVPTNPHPTCSTFLNEPNEPTESPTALTPLDPDAFGWNLSCELYDWIFQVLYPKQRTNKEKSAPYGQCWFCSAVSKHAGSLQQHLIVLHRQRLARKVRTGREFNGLLALGFVVAQMESEFKNKTSGDLEQTRNEWLCFKELLTLSPLSNETLQLRAFPMLTRKLNEFCLQELWIGVSCPHCGTWATRRVALKEHTLVCAGRKSVGALKSSVSPHTPVLQLTDSGRAARPARGPRRKRSHRAEVIPETSHATPRAPLV